MINIQHVILNDKIQSVMLCMSTSTQIGLAQKELT